MKIERREVIFVSFIRPKGNGPLGLSFDCDATLQHVPLFRYKETIPMRVLTIQSSPAHAGTLFLPMRIPICVELNEAGVLSFQREPPLHCADSASLHSG